MLLQIFCPLWSARTVIGYFLAAQGFFAAQGFLAAQGFAAQGFAAFFFAAFSLAFFCTSFLCCFMSQGFFAPHGLAFIAHGLPFMAPFIAQGFSAAYAEEAAIIATTPNIANNFFISDSPLNVD